MTTRGARTRFFTPAECARLGRCPICEWHPPTQGHAPTCPHWPDWHVAGGKPNRPYIGPTTEPARNRDPVDAGPDALDLDLGDGEP